MLNQELNGSILREKGIRLIIKREDLLHPEIQGNKWRKLKYNLAFAQKEGYAQILTFGGAFSNHIAALAAAGIKFGLKTVGIIRGERSEKLNPTLLKAQQNGMLLQFVSRSVYKSYTQSGNTEALQNEYPDTYIIPEGGTNTLAIKGCEEILTEEDKNNFDYFACPVGTAGTITGIISSLKGNKKILAFPALKGSFIQKDVETLLKLNNTDYTNFRLIDNYHFGGYAKHKPELLDFIHNFYEMHQIPLDPIYTGKMMYGLYDLIEQDQFEVGANILAIHTGGLQGIAGFNDRFGTQLKAI